MKTNRTRAVFFATLVVLTLAALPLRVQAAQNNDGWSPYSTWEPQYNASNYSENKTFDSGFGATSGHLLTQAEMDEARAHVGLQNNVPTDAWAYTAHVNIPFN